MFNSKYSKVLTVILIIVIIGIVGTISYFVYDIYVVKSKNNKAQETIDQFSQSSIRREFDNDEDKNNGQAENPLDSINSLEKQNSAEKTYMEGYEVMGIIEIPKIGIKYPILASTGKRALEIAVGLLYGELNQVGNATIVGHNYRNGLFFSDNKKLSKGDIVKITDQLGTTVTYEIYDMFEQPFSNASFIQRDTAGAKEISLSTCTDASNDIRLIILAKEK